ISIVADNLDAAMVKAKLLFDTLDMPKKPDGLRILDQAKQELFSGSRMTMMLKCRRQAGSLVTVAAENANFWRGGWVPTHQGRVHFSKALRSAEYSLPTRSWRTLFRFCHPIRSIR